MMKEHHGIIVKKTAQSALGALEDGRFLLGLRGGKSELKVLIDAGRIDDVPEFLAKSSLSEAERKAI